VSPLAPGSYESQIVVPQWLTTSPTSEYQWNAAAARQANTGLRFWVYVNTVPLTLLSVANLVAAWRATGTMRRWWSIAVASESGKPSSLSKGVSD